MPATITYFIPKMKVLGVRKNLINIYKSAGFFYLLMWMDTIRRRKIMVFLLIKIEDANEKNEVEIVILYIVRNIFR